VVLSKIFRTMIYTVYADQQYQDRKIPLLAVFIIVKKDNKNKGIKKFCGTERYVITTNAGEK